MKKRTMKRVTITAIAATLLISALGGCTQAQSAESQTTAAPTTAESTTAESPTKETTTAASLNLKIPNPPAQDGSKILFVGNSHTYVNDLPGLFYELALAAGHEVNVYEWSQGSYYLEMFADPEDEMGSVLVDALENETWDFVILQENTNAAMNAIKDMLPQAKILDEMIKESGAQTGFLMTWAPEDGLSFYSREKVQSLLSDGYQTVADELDALLIPGGISFGQAISLNPELQLWGDDGMHASLEGTYLAACTAYAVLFQESPVGNSFISELDEETAATLQQAAQNICSQ